MRVLIGTSGYSYDEWKDEFYKNVSKTRWFDCYVDHFDTVELNATFYRLQSEKTLRNWAESTPDDFVFTAKGHRYVTHTKRLRDADEMISRSRDNMAPLSEKLEVVVWQLPANFHRDDDRLRRFCDVLEKRWFDVRHTLEFRHRSWFEDEVGLIVADHGHAVCLSDAPDWPMWRYTDGADFVYARLHGHTRLYASQYSPTHLDRWAREIHRWLDDRRDVYIYFDNTAESHAPRDARRLRERIDGIYGTSTHTQPRRSPTS